MKLLFQVLLAFSAFSGAANGSDYEKVMRCDDLVLDRYVVADERGFPQAAYQAVIAGGSADAMKAEGVTGSKVSSRGEILFDGLTFTTTGSDALFFVATYSEGSGASLTFVMNSETSRFEAALEIRTDGQNRVDFFHDCENFSF